MPVRDEKVIPCLHIKPFLPGGGGGGGGAFLLGCEFSTNSGIILSSITTFHMVLNAGMAPDT